MKVLKILGWVCLFSVFSMLLQGFSMMQSPEVPDPRIAYVYFAMAGFFAILALIFLCIKGKKDESSSRSGKKINENYYKKRGKSANYKLRVFISFILSFGVAIAIAYFLPDRMKTFELIGGTVWKYIIFFGIFFLAFAIYSGREIRYFENADLFINTNCFIPFTKGVNLGNFIVYRFRSWFPGIFSKGPLVYTTEEKGTATRRKIYMYIITVVKYVCPFLALIGFASALLGIFQNGIEMFSPEFAVASFGSICGLLILCLGPTLDVFFYAIGKMFPLRESATYEITTYYEGGKVEKRTEIRTNIIAIMIGAFAVYVYCSGWFWYICACNMARVKDTNKLMAYGRKAGRKANFVEYYLDENAN
ncbi:MAG: hypothetical protein IKJ19_05035 [Clostridia bacterium]|nr:hypothetical protein [Clostridia bacterium]